MVRHHGWELPAHAFQVVAITVFFLLVVAYYVFFAPFVGPTPIQYGAYALYSPLAFIVFVLYVRCTGIDPSDSGIASADQQKFAEMHDMKGFMSESSGSVVHRHGSSDLPPQVEVSRNEGGVLSLIAGALCGWLVIPDSCKREPAEASLEEDNLYCTLCEAEVHKFSKHCRSCDKCVDGFDHHCRWLNNCVGKKNYASFVVLMASSLALLILQWGTGIAVIAHCFTNKRAADRQIVEKLGNSFSRAPFASVVAACTAVSLIASIPLGELFFFHLILMRKGITTYEYVVAMRAQNEPTAPSVEGDAQSMPSSPGSSIATGLTGSSSVGLQYRGAWCTPPRVFVEHQDEVIPHLEPGRVPSTVDPDAVPKFDKKAKRAVRISAWKLAKLDPGQVTKAAAKAREKSSVMRQISGKDAEADYSSSDIGSSRSSASTEFGVLRGKRIEGSPRMAAPNVKRDFSIQFDSGDGVTSSRSSMSSPRRHTMNDSDELSPLPSRPNYAPANTLRLSTPRGVQENAPTLGVRTSSYKPHLYPRAGVPPSRPWGTGKSDGSSLDSLEELGRGRQRVQVYDQVVGRPDRNSVYSYLRQWPQMSTSTSYDLEKPPLAPAAPPPPQGASDNLSAPPAPPRRPPPPLPPRRPDDLLYQENTIFFGGPLAVPGTRSSSAHQQKQEQPVSRFNPLTRSSIPGGESSVFSAGGATTAATFATDPRQQRFLPAGVRASIMGTDRLHSPVFLPRSSGAYPPV